MNKGRLEAFSDGVIAIIITIMVLELKVPRGTDWNSLYPLLPVFLCYILSFIYLGIYWNNHHHLLQAVKFVNGRTLWANMHLLFWLSLTPFVTGWMGENNFESLPVALYGAVMFFAGVAYYILTLTLISQHGENSSIAVALGKDFKGKISILLYAAAVLLAFINSLISGLIYILVAVIWLVPDKRIEKILTETK